MSEAAFYTTATRQRVTDAVAKVESATAAELVVVVQRASGAWREVDLAVASAAAFAVLLLVLFHPMPIPIAAMPVDVALGFVAGGLLCASVSPLKRALLPRRRVATQVRAAARGAFFDQGVSRTTGRTGVLVYVSTFERRVELVSDVGVDPAVLEEAGRSLAAAVADGADVDAFVTALEGMGAPLGAALPRAADDVNELPDAPVMA